MTKEQFEKFLIDNRKSTAEAIELTVNGKIKKIHELLERQNETSDLFRKKVEKHIEVVEPYILGYESVARVSGWVGKSLMYIGGFVLTVGGAYIFIKHNLLNNLPK